MNIYIKDLSNKKEYHLPSLPENIQLKTGSQWTTYNLINGNECKVRAGNLTKELAWDGKFFGSKRKGQEYVISKGYRSPKEWRNLFLKWRKNNTKLNVRITTIGVNMKVQVDRFDRDIGEGSAYGDICYSVSFCEYGSINVEVEKKNKKSSKNKGKSKSNRSSEKSSNYTVKPGDSLWRIALKYYGSGADNKKIYTVNKAKIEAEAKKRGHPSSKNGNLIFPGTTLKIP